MNRIALALAATIAALPTGPALAAPGSAAGLSLDDIAGYRIELDDCPATACGTRSFASAEAFGDFLRAESDRRRAMGQARGTGRSQDDGKRQVVYLDFNNDNTSFTPLLAQPDGSFVPFGTFVGHFYDQAEQDAILARLEADYARFDIEFTTVPPTSGEFTTLEFNDNADPENGPGVILIPNPSGGFGLSIGFGLADNIDFRNSDRGDDAGIDANFWELLVQGFGEGAFRALSGISAAQEPDLEAALSLAVVNQSANTAAHELGHILGLRHHDAFGKPGDGLPATGFPDPLEFVPVFEGPQAGAEAVLHLMASGASVGLGLTGSTRSDRFLSERSAIKTLLTQRGPTISEEKATAKGGPIGGKRKGQKLQAFVTPNTLVLGANAGTNNLRADALVIEGAIAAEGEIDVFRFRGRAGENFNAELVSFTDDNIVEPVIAQLALLRDEGDGTLTPLAQNAQTFEPFDPFLFDVELPADGDYVVVVSAPDVVFLDLNGDGFFNNGIPLSVIGAGEFLTGDYELLLYSVDRPLGRAR